MTKAYEMLDTALSSTDAWLTRVELAKIIGRPGYVLQQGDRVALDKLMLQGKVEGKRMKRHKGDTVWVYRRAENGN